MLLIKEEKRVDFDAIKVVNDKAFNQPQEENVIDKIRSSGSRILSLVAEVENKLVGHIFFSPDEIDGNDEIKNGIGFNDCSS